MLLPLHPQFTSSGALCSLHAGGLSLLQYPASEVEAGPQQLWLRFRDDGGIAAYPLTGPGSGGSIARGDETVVITGRHRTVEWVAWWGESSQGASGWSVRLRNEGAEQTPIDVVYLIDPALAATETLRQNEFYVSNYLDVQPLGEGAVEWIAVRQNMPGERNAWMAVGSTAPIAAWCTDALQLVAAEGGLDLSQDLPSHRLQAEHTLVGLQTEAVRLASGESRVLHFPIIAIADHPEATGSSDLVWLDSLHRSTAWRTSPPELGPLSPIASTLFSSARIVNGEDLTDSEFLSLAVDPVGVEHGPEGRPWAYWSGGRHVVSAAKEREVLRPHGHIARVSAGYGPHDRTVACTAWMGGTFASQLTAGHASDSPLLSVRRSYLGLKRAEGLRLFVRAEEDASWSLLGMASAWWSDGAEVRWIYQWDGRRCEVRSVLSLTGLTIEVEITAGGPLELLVSTHADAAAARGEDALLFSDGTGRSDDRHASRFSSASGFQFTIPFEQGLAAPVADWTAPAVRSSDEGVQRLNRVLPSFTQNAVVHYQAPRGLEQFTGGAWGTRDVSQGPVSLLMATGHPDELREVLLTVFAGQQTDGDWPQSFEYLEENRRPGHRASHGDVVYWPLLALGEYLELTADIGVLTVEVPFVGAEADSAPASILDHVRAAFAHLSAQRSADGRLPAYGHGDWNDSLQPANRDLARSMVSTWTTELEIKALGMLGGQLGRGDADLAGRMLAMAEDARAAFRERLLIDGELCGYSIITQDGLEPLVHPADRRTGIAHGSLQIIHAIGDELLTAEEAQHHLAVIDEHLDGPTGIYLFSEPIRYRGGETHTFLRAEAASFWGREIGLMYTHAHIRWVQALLRLGLADRAWAALQLLVPEGMRNAVPGAAPRQSNCYYSSSDAGFDDRYDAQDHPDRLFDPQFRFEGGWRVYSSGPGLIVRMLVEDLLGCRWTAAGLVVDPVLPRAFDGATARLSLGGRDVEVEFRVAGGCTGVSALALNGRSVDGEPVARRYRPGGMRIPRSTWDALPQGDVRLLVTVGAA